MCDAPVIVTSGTNYLDIDAYACCVAMRDLLVLRGKRALAYSKAPANYSVCDFLIEPGQIANELPEEFTGVSTQYIIVDVSDPEFIRDTAELSKISEVFDHHTGFEEYWKNRIGQAAHIEFTGAAATIVYREWRKAGLQAQMSRSTACLLMAAILDNTLNMNSANTTQEDIDTYNELCALTDLPDEWRERYFSAVQENVECDLLQALAEDVKRIRDNRYLPSHIAQLCVWNAESAIEKLREARELFDRSWEHWMINLVDIRSHTGYFICYEARFQSGLEAVFNVHFVSGVAKTERSYLRKEIIKLSKEYSH